MEWDLNEPTCLSKARLMVASPEFVYEQFRFSAEYREEGGKLGLGKYELEEGLLTRDDKLINLAPAQFACNDAVVRALYHRANSGAGEKDEYDLALRVACLSNRNAELGRYGGWQEFGLTGRGDPTD